jgi:hypothetical protein
MTTIQKMAARTARLTAGVKRRLASEARETESRRVPRVISSGPRMVSFGRFHRGR